MDEELSLSVYRLVEAIPAGKVLTYGEIAALLGRPRNSRLVGRILSQTPPGRETPCHRVVNAVGRPLPVGRSRRSSCAGKGCFFARTGRVDRKRSGWRPWEDSCGGTGKKS